MPLARVRSWISQNSRRSETVAGEIPESFCAYINVIEFWHNGASLDLTLEGLRFGRASSANSLQLAEAVTAQAGWRGTRTQKDIAQEIRDHCRAWFWLPILRSRANPVDLEFFDSWPGSLLITLRLKKSARPRS